MNATPRLIALAAACGALALFACDAAEDGADDDAMQGDTSKPSDTKVSGDTGSNTNRPPELERIGDRVAPVNDNLVIVVQAKDPDGDELTYSVFGALPEGARFDKTAHRFEWTPATAGKTVFLTFVVSDGSEFNRETVRIEVVSQGQQNAPEFVSVGDQQLTAGQPFELQLEATDKDGDTLTYGYEGTLPTGATFAEKTGLFRWTPTAAFVGQPIRLTFTVSDGALSDTLNVSLVVSDGSGGQAPPEFQPLPAQMATVGQLLTFTLVATDPNSDPLTYAIDDGAPAGAQLSGATFNWTPAQDDAGRTYNVTFSVTDQTFTAVTTVQISVSSGMTGNCTADAEEPNETVDTATPITPGTLQKTICETADASDLDVYAITVPAGQQLDATLTLDPALGDLDLYLVDAAQDFLGVSETLTATEMISWTATTEATVFLVVIGFGPEPIAMGYTLTTALVAPAVCTEDGFEDNDSAAAAKPLPPDETELQICAGDADFWTLTAGCGQQIEVGMEVKNQASDLDLYLYDNPEGSGWPVASAATEDSFEVLSLAKAETSGTYVLEVSGYPFATAESGYELITDFSGGCTDDAHGGTNSGTAKALANDGPTLTDLMFCCVDDWFALTLADGDQVLVDANVTAGAEGTVGLTVLGSDAMTQIASKDPSSSGASVQFTAESAGVHYLVTKGAVGTSYHLTWLVESGSAGCDSLSCSKYRVCDSTSGECVLNWCSDTAPCPGGYICRQTWCVDPCTSDDQCRDDFACKTFDAGKHCGIAGDEDAGGDCSDFTSCGGSLVCGDGGTCVQL